ncbi:hypothetical protein EIP91_001964 [Steccherinum ochraceum]|uniref:Uncharacterized protein n=1 Tax=Steccherinum ochraceum TaxID=92696 RepID=A0A4R0RFA2_9APHY|nr:hypothetical protein EIP91_001964 [Steccherinum ochraceum]
MQSSQDAPALALEDIMHTSSPSPAPQPPPALSSTDEAPSLPAIAPNTPQQSFYAQRPVTPHSPDHGVDTHPTRSRLQELGLLGSDSTPAASMTSREKELLDMILSMTAPQPDGYADQLSAQAETISGLIQQRSFLIQQRVEDHTRWDAERQSWQRTTEVLSSQRRAPADPSAVDEETQRKMALSDSDIKALKVKLAEAQQRTALLETELNRLRPLLLAQPIESLNIEFALHGTAPTPTTARPVPVIKRRSARIREAEAGKEKETLQETGEEGDVAEIEKGKEKEKEANGTPEVPDVDMADTQDQNSPPPPPPPPPEADTQPDNSQSSIPHVHPPNPSGSQHYRLLKEREAGQRKHKLHSRSLARGSASAPGTLLADARNEMLLNAIRKVGRIKAGIQAGIVKRQEEREVEEQELSERQKERAKEKEKQREARRRLRKQANAKDAEVQVQSMPSPNPISAPPPPLQLQFQTQTPGAGPSKPTATAHNTPKTPRGIVHTQHHPHLSVQSYPQALHPSQHPPTHQFVYISPVQASGRGYGHPHPHPQQQQNGTHPSPPQPMYVSYWPGAPPAQPPMAPSTPTVASGSGRGRGRGGRGGGRKRKPVEGEGEMELDTVVQNGSKTPMDSLVSAARTMSMLVEADFGDGDGEEVAEEEDVDAAEDPAPARTTRNPTTATGRKRRRGGARAAVEAGSPQPKRRKVAPAPSSLHPSTLLATPNRGGPPPHTHNTYAQAHSTPRGAPPTRTRSALDVLAETAQAQELERRPSVEGSHRESGSPEPTQRANGTGSRGALHPSAVLASRAGKGKEKARGDDEAGGGGSRSRSMSNASTDSRRHPADHPAYPYSRTPVNDRTHPSHQEEGESELSEDEDEDATDNPPRRTLRHTSLRIAQPPPPPAQMQQSQSYKPRKALHQFQFVPPSPETVRTSTAQPQPTPPPRVDTSDTGEMRPDRSTTLSHQPHTQVTHSLASVATPAPAEATQDRASTSPDVVRPLDARGEGGDSGVATNPAVAAPNPSAAATSTTPQPQQQH